jgi:hypothetical protein
MRSIKKITRATNPVRFNQSTVDFLRTKKSKGV